MVSPTLCPSWSTSSWQSEIAGQNGSVLDDFLKLVLSLFVADGINDSCTLAFESFGNRPSNTLLVGKTNDKIRFARKPEKAHPPCFSSSLIKARAKERSYLAFAFDLAGHVEKLSHSIAKRNGYFDLVSGEDHSFETGILTRDKTGVAVSSIRDSSRKKSARKTAPV